MTVKQRTLLVAILVAAIVGFAAGWFARLKASPSLESRMIDAERSVRDKVNEVVK